MKKRFMTGLLALVVAIAVAGSVQAKALMMATTTSTDNTGLLDYLAPEFTKDTGIELKWTSVGTGKALKLGMNCDVDVLLVHAPVAEKRYIEDGYAESRTEIMYNDFVIVGPKADPAGVKGMAVEKALSTIRDADKTFVSRGDNSGTNKKEILLWKAAGGPLPEKEAWYVQTGQGMLSTLNITAERGGYTMTDRGTYIKEYCMGNQIKTTMLLTVLTLLIVMAGRVIGGQGGMVIALVLAGGMNFYAYFYSDKMVLKMYKAQEVGKNEAPQLWNMVQELSSRAGLPMPKVCIIPQQSPNAFATGRNPEHGVIAVTQGLLDLMSPEEIKGVLAHELGHIKNRDILVGTVAATLAGAIMTMATMARWAAIFGGGRSDEEGGSGIFGLIAMSIIAPMAAMVVQMAISRSREYLADATAAQITGNPEGLAGALEKLSAASSRIPMDAEPATAHMFIINPLSGRTLANLFSTHPPIEERVARLRGAKPRPTGSAPKKTASTNPWDNIRGK